MVLVHHPEQAVLKVLGAVHPTAVELKRRRRRKRSRRRISLLTARLSVPAYGVLAPLCVSAAPSQHEH